MNVIDQAAIETVDNSYWVLQADALERLEKNPDFRMVILEGYFKDKAIRGTSLLATDAVKRAGVRPDVMEGLIAISALEDHFKTIRLMGGISKQDIEDEFDDEPNEKEGE